VSTAALDRQSLPAAPPKLIRRERRRTVSPFRNVPGAVGDVLLLVGIILCLPLAILAIGIPVVLTVQLLLWIVRLI
jgi:hypothetical protein